MTAQCIYCGMELGDEYVEQEIEGKKIAFCSHHCAVVFEGLDKKGRMKAAIMRERDVIISSLENGRSTKVITLIHRREPWEEENEGFISIEDTEHP